jgi:hypothetical protein
MRNGKKLSLLTVLLCTMACSFSNQGIKEQIKEIKKLEYGANFLKGHSEKKLYQIRLFADNPTKYFGHVQNIKDWCAYFEIWDHYLSTVKNIRKGCFETLLGHFSEVDGEKVAILDFLIVNDSTCGFYAESLSYYYTILFSKHPEIFIKDLEKRRDWKDIIKTLYSGEWGAFETTVSKLGDSEFEQELKAYVAELDRILLKKFRTRGSGS